MKDVRFIWGLPQEDSFMKLKELITLAPVLVLPNNNLPFRLEADGSGITTGTVLSLSEELLLTYLPLYSLLSLPFYSLFSILPCHILTGSISSDCDHYGHSHVM
jgi:hypothetical protein